MKAITLAFVTFLAFAPTVIATANAGDQRTGTAFDIAQQYAHGGKFAGVTSGKTGTTLEVARDSLAFLGSFDRIASIPPALAQGG
jgi:hypothetical protein